MARFDLGHVQVDLLARSVTAADRSAIALSWRGFEALRLLIEARGNVVDRAKMLDALWPDVTVDDSNLSQLVTHLRRDLGPHADLIETVPRRGYRLKAAPVPIAPVPVAEAFPPTPIAATLGSTSADEAVRSVPSSPSANAPRSAGFGNWLWWTAASVLVLAAGAYFLQRHLVREQAAQVGRQAIALVRAGGPANQQAGIVELQRALAIDPDAALVQAWFAEATGRGLHSKPTNAAIIARRSVELDPQCGECQAILGWLLLTRDWKIQESGTHLQRAHELDPKIRVCSFGLRNTWR